MQSEDLLKGEKVETVLSPHPLSFMKLQAVCILLIVWGLVVTWLASESQFKQFFAGNHWLTVIVWGIVLLLIGVVIALVSIRWSVFFLYLGVFLGAVGLIYWQNLLSQVTLFIPIYSVIASIVGFLCVEVYRRSHRYLITNQRLVFSGGIITKRTRAIRYDKITEFNTEQGILGQIFGFGTIIPVSESGLGLGSDKSFAGAGAGGGSKLRLFGFAGGGRDVNVPRTRSFYELYGVHPFKEILKIVNEHHQGTDITPYQKEQVDFQRQQVDIQKQMRDLLKKQTHGSARKAAGPDDEDEDPEDEEPQPVRAHRPKLRPAPVEDAEPEQQEAFGKNQVDIQQQMKELLKKQRSIKAAAVEEEENTEEAEAEETEDDAKSKLPG